MDLPHQEVDYFKPILVTEWRVPGTYKVNKQTEDGGAKRVLLLPTDDQIDSDAIDQLGQFGHVISFFFLLKKITTKCTHLRLNNIKIVDLHEK